MVDADETTYVTREAFINSESTIWLFFAFAFGSMMTDWPWINVICFAVSLILALVYGVATAVLMFRRGWKPPN